MALWFYKDSFVDRESYSKEEVLDWIKSAGFDPTIVEAAIQHGEPITKRTSSENYEALISVKPDNDSQFRGKLVLEETQISESGHEFGNGTYLRYHYAAA